MWGRSRGCGGQIGGLGAWGVTGQNGGLWGADKGVWASGGQMEAHQGGNKGAGGQGGQGKLVFPVPPPGQLNPHTPPLPAGLHAPGPEDRHHTAAACGRHERGRPRGRRDGHQAGQRGDAGTRGYGDTGGDGIME